MPNKTENWKKPIDTRDFAGFVSPSNISDPAKEKIEKIQNNYDGYSLMAKVRMTFAGLQTKNSAIYMPDEMYNGGRTFITPYPKPILTHHDEEKDPIGRIVDVRYVDTTGQASMIDERVTSAMKPFRDKNSSKKSKLKAVELFQDLSMNHEDEYRGVGHLMGLWNITDFDAIQKTIDKRYLTVSTTFTPKGAHCSTCLRDGRLTDWREEWCEHDRGQVYDGYPCVAIPFGFEYDEVSPVNMPAAIHAQIIEYGQDLSFEDAVSKVSDTILPKHNLFDDLLLVKDNIGFRFSDGVECNLNNRESNLDLFSQEKPERSSTVTVIGNYNKKAGVSQTDKMNIQTLISDSKKNYEELVKVLPANASRMTGDLLGELDQACFAGPNRTFPVKDKAHLEGCFKLLEKVEDSDEKAIVLSNLETFKKKFQDLEEKAQDDVQEEVAKELESDSVDTTEQVQQVTISQDEYESLKEAQRDLNLVKAAKDCLSQRVVVLQAELDYAHKENSNLLSELKTSLAERLVDAKIRKGGKITDKAEKIGELSEKSIQSLRDSLEVLSDIPDSGMSRTPSGEKVSHPSFESDETASRKTESDSSDEVYKQYRDIIDRFYDIAQRQGDRKAQEFLTEQKRAGRIPAALSI